MLPIVGQRPAERADAARNRRKILLAASRLIAENGAEHLSLDEVADAAQVGVGTVYRRFGDRAGLVQSLLDERERQFQEAFMQGPPPLGPGAPPQERVRAFLHALVDRVEEQSDLLLVAEATTPAVRYNDGPYPVRHLHLVTLLAQLRPDANAHYLAHALLAPLSASLVIHQRTNEGLGVERIKSGIDDLLALVGVRAEPDPAT
ncbi:TetR/AcrR family transcriptional regulator [Saccharopolyspora erythraea]|uniref:TetR/AcrR family transcriptional regulator n=1 Tax=Saccharopolyspora erythraea TaxID=1836 RepID=UPI001BA4A8F5|nr:TetR/AcrR family transcriptional regulator [Saccharopolyspora erythraea]QUH06212.1 TetR/AcrR family transcriptional regulator [Saccharopolyspora erythraea]